MRKILNSSILFGFLCLCLFSGLPSYAQDQPSDERVYIKIEVKGLACPYCAFGMEKELKKISGVEKVEIELKEGLAFISTPISQKPEKQKLAQVITDSGFTPGNIEYSPTPFIRKKEGKKE